jgi:hypothetical protein
MPSFACACDSDGDLAAHYRFRSRVRLEIM